MQNVLIIDDDPKLLKMLQRTLVYENLNVLTATNGVEALPLVQSQRPDLIIVDWMMPKMDGLSFIQRLREFCTPRGIGFFMVGSNTDLQDLLLKQLRAAEVWG